jgi:hypothetical protein
MMMERSRESSGSSVSYQTPTETTPEEPPNGHVTGVEVAETALEMASKKER